MTNFDENVKNIIDSGSPILGASSAPSENDVVKFAYTTELSKVATAENGQLVFVDLDGTGAIYAGSSLVSSKILDVSYLTGGGRFHRR